MNLLRSLFKFPASSSFPTLRNFSVSPAIFGEKKPKKKGKQPGTKTSAELIAELALTPAAGSTLTLPTNAPVLDKYGHHPRNPRNKHYHRHGVLPKVDWAKNIDWNLPRDSVLSFRPLGTHRWQNWQMLRDVRNRAYIARDGRRRKLLLLLYRCSRVVPRELGEAALGDIHKMVRNSMFINKVERCKLTSRARGVVSKWGLSRLVWRHYVDNNLLSGVLRAVWGNRHNQEYVHMAAPDLHNTLVGLDPLYGEAGKRYSVYENSWSGAERPAVQYNENVYKDPFTYIKPTDKLPPYYPPPRNPGHPQHHKFTKVPQKFDRIPPNSHEYKLAERDVVGNKMLTDVVAKGI